MGTLHNVWERLKALLASALQGKQKAPNAKADPKKLAGPVQQFTTSFQAALAQIDKAHATKKQLDAVVIKAAEDALKSVQALKQQVDAANKDGLTDGKLREDLDGRIDELASRLRELRNNGFAVPWD